MSTESVSTLNKALMERIFEGIGEGDPTLFYERLADDATLLVTGECSWSQTIRGKDRMREFYGYVRSRLAARGRTHAFHFLADGDWVVVEARGDMVMASGQPYRNHYCLFFRLDGGRIVEMKEYQDTSLVEKVFGPFPVHIRRNSDACALKD